MIEQFTALLSALRHSSPIIFLGLAIFSGTILFGADSFVHTVGLGDFKKSNVSYLGGIFIGSISILLAQFLFQLYKLAGKIVVRLNKRRSERNKLIMLTTELSKLTPDEKSYLVPYILNQDTSVNFLAEDGIKGSLENKRILQQASEIGRMLSGFAYILQPWAREHLEANPHLLDGASNAFENRFPSIY